MPPRPPSSTLFPYTTLFRSALESELDALDREDDRRWQVYADRVTLVLVQGHDHTVGQVVHAVSELVGVERDLVERLRSEEHTSELQSHSDLVCRLLLEKKKQ